MAETRSQRPLADRSRSGQALALTAIAGMTAGSVACAAQANLPDSATAEQAAARAAGSVSPKACCKGMNECKAKGNCKTAQNECKGKNECRALGGCKAPDCK